MERNQDPSEGSPSDSGEAKNDLSEDSSPDSSESTCDSSESSLPGYGEPKCKKKKVDEEKSEEEDSFKDKSFDTSDEDEDSSSSTDDESNSPRDISNIPGMVFVKKSQKDSYMITQLIKKIQKFGRISGRIFDLLDDVRGPLRAKKSFVQFAIQEAGKFKGNFLIEQLKDYLESMITYHQWKRSTK